MPVALVEALVPGRAADPWLRGPGLGVVGTLFVLGAAATRYGTLAQEQFTASPAQQLGTVVGVLAVTTLALLPRSRPRRGPVGRAPAPWLVGVATFAATGAFMAGRDLNTWPTVAAWLVLIGVTGSLLLRWSWRGGWGSRHRFAAAGGALLTYAWVGFPMAPLVGPGGTVDLVGNAVLAAAAVAVLVASWRRMR